MKKYGLKGPKRKSLHGNSIITGINSILYRLCQNYSSQPILVAGAVVPEDSLHQGTARAPPSLLQADGQLVDPPRQVEVLLQHSCCRERGPAGSSSSVETKFISNYWDSITSYKNWFSICFWKFGWYDPLHVSQTFIGKTWALDAGTTEVPTRNGRYLCIS